MIVDAAVLNQAVGADVASTWLAPLEAACARFYIRNPARLAAFLAQTSYESGAFQHLEENLNYSALGLTNTFPKHFNAVEAAKYAHHKEWIANKVYGGRYGNGDEASGDGWKYRGRGLIQITFRDNYRDCGHYLALDLLADPDLLLEPQWAALSAAWYWVEKGLNLLADYNDFKRITVMINGGLRDYDERVKRWNLAKRALGIL